MRQLIALFSIVLIISACNDSGKKAETSKEPPTKIDALLKDIDDMHIDGMKEMAKLTSLQQKAKAALDSLDKLPAQVKSRLASYRQRLDSVVKNLDYAEFAMDKWMPEFYSNVDTLKDKAAERMDYLLNEKLKVTKITDQILGGIKQADSLLKAKLP